MMLPDAVFDVESTLPIDPTTTYRLFGVLVTDPEPGSRRQFYWLGTFPNAPSAVGGAVRAALVYGLAATREHCRRVYQFGSLDPMTIDFELVASWSVGNERRGIASLNDVDADGRPVIGCPEDATADSG